MITAAAPDKIHPNRPFYPVGTAVTTWDGRIAWMLAYDTDDDYTTYKVVMVRNDTSIESVYAQSVPIIEVSGSQREFASLHRDSLRVFTTVWISGVQPRSGPPPTFDTLAEAEKWLSQQPLDPTLAATIVVKGEVS